MKGLLLTYLLTAAASLGSIFNPLWGLYVYVGFAVVRPQFMFGWAGDLTDISLIVGVAVLVGWAARGFGGWQLGRSRSIVVVLLFYAGWYGISTALAADQTLAFFFWRELLKIVLPFCVGVTLMKDEREWRTFLWIIVLCQAYVGLELNLDYFRGSNTAADGYGGMDNNCLGVSLVTVLGAAIALVVTTRRWYERGLAVFCAGVILHTTLLTFSRGAMVGLLVLGGTAFLALPKRPSYIAVIVLTALIGFKFTGPQLLARYSTTFASEDERDPSAQSRLDLWRDCLKVIESAPVFGIGPANWRSVATQFGWAEGKSAHSVWMETAAEVGIPGVLALFSFFALAALRLWPLARARLDDSNRNRVGAAMAVVLAVAGFASSGQFVSLAGLEIPYYIVMIGAAVLKIPAERAARSVEAEGSTGQSARDLPVRPADVPSPSRRPARKLFPDLGLRPRDARTGGACDTAKILPHI
jgi:O-antigen ligase